LLALLVGVTVGVEEVGVETGVEGSGVTVVEVD